MKEQIIKHIIYYCAHSSNLVGLIKENKVGEALQAFANEIIEVYNSRNKPLRGTKYFNDDNKIIIKNEETY